MCLGLLWFYWCDGFLDYFIFDLDDFGVVMFLEGEEFFNLFESVLMIYVLVDDVEEVVDIFIFYGKGGVLVLFVFEIVRFVLM